MNQLLYFHVCFNLLKKNICYILVTDGSDFVASSKVVALAPGETEDRVRVPIIDDSIAEDTETFTATLSTGDVDLDSNHIATVTILDDDNKGMCKFSLYIFDGEIFLIITL